MSSSARRLQTKPVITCLKTFLIVFSFLFWITGVVLLAVGVWGKLSLEEYLALVADKSTNAPYVLIGTGATIIVFGLFGCFATCRGSTWMLKLYAMILSLLFLAQIVAGISGFIFRHEIRSIFKVSLEKAINQYSRNGTDFPLDYMQINLHCCGVQNYTDWLSTGYFKENGIPFSCCKNHSDCKPGDLKNATIVKDKVYDTGCFQLVTNFMETNIGIIAGIAFGIAFFQLFGILLACCLSRYITNNQYEMV
uniref:Tetraspanin n=1 Tax=Callorhinchus milii TaxID=7868 RepID=K4FUU5_CALMI|nr:tetraspanin-7-like protein [Callorhinchus milii]|eukprot:gi/632935369/ref/XP_007889811.1/ PREDICTED: tetraspanin-6 [Callorhinchus milii]